MSAAPAPPDRANRGLKRLLRVITIAYVVLGALALFAIPASVEGWAGVEPDPLSGIFALLLALPWSLLLMLVGDAGPWPSFLVCAAGIALNTFILWRISRTSRQGPTA
ncbi:SCO4225 family membrane protein [Sphingomicrobium aestuariivivum]|uniref:SCO4225 family membrane protein n=1 Tax=Sphingomicrobium aestuariivivum TaxID=1582356 RepID=UPI001FD6CBAD|nr:hypothetical protein [Sphingomicrobium aestuariivivum]MCJ8190700.1 hypothetical protein [Sphingomicrobium aestuariivivum]